MLNWIIRYQPVIRLLDQRAATSVLDVGSGWHGLSLYWPHTVVQTDISFQGCNPWSERAGAARFVTASAERLPFCDEAFDFAVSLDMMEHLPEVLRQPFVRELARVARRGIIVGYPVGAPARRVDRALDRLFRYTPRMGVPVWLQEHLAQEAYPQRQLLQRSLPQNWAITDEAKNENTYLAVVRAYAELLPALRNACDRLEDIVRRRGVPSFVDRGTTYRTVYVAAPN